MSRLVLLQTIDVQLVAAETAPAPGGDPAAVKRDVQVEFVGADADGNFQFAIPAYDPSRFNVLEALHVSLFEKPADGPDAAAIVPADPAEIVKAPLHFVTDTSKLQAGGTVVVDATEAPEGDYSAALVAEFDQ